VSASGDGSFGNTYDGARKHVRSGGRHERCPSIFFIARTRVQAGTTSQRNSRTEASSRADISKLTNDMRMVYKAVNCDV
jgi:hypothetical protein